MSARTPLRVGSATVWADPETGTVRCGTPSRYRTLLAGLDPASYLVGGEDVVLVTAADTDKALSFSLHSDVFAAIGPSVKPAWCPVVEAVLGRPGPVTDWLEVGLSAPLGNWYCSIPLGRLPHLHTGVARQGLQLTYITRIRSEV